MITSINKSTLERSNTSSHTSKQLTTRVLINTCLIVDGFRNPQQNPSKQTTNRTNHGREAIFGFQECQMGCASNHVHRNLPEKCSRTELMDALIEWIRLVQIWFPRLQLMVGSHLRTMALWQLESAWIGNWITMIPWLKIRAGKWCMWLLPKVILEAQFCFQPVPAGFLTSITFWGFQSPKGQNEWIQIDSGMFFRVTLILWGKDASLGLLIFIDFYMFIFLQFLVVSLF